MVKQAAIMSNFDQLETYEKGCKIQAWEEAIEIFKKFKDEPMTGNVVIIELMGLIHHLKKDDEADR